MSQREEDTRHSDDALILSTDYASVNHAPPAASSVAALKERNFIPTTVEAVRQARSNSSNWALTRVVVLNGANKNGRLTVRWQYRISHL